MQVSCIDISRAYFHARVTDEHPLYVHLPPEDPDYGSGLCGKLNVHLYGTRPAAEGWYSEYTSTMVEMGFEVGTSTACVFRHTIWHLVCSVHGDDFATAGPKSSLEKFVEELKKKYEFKESARL